jgi:hypothetical protein
VSRLSGTGSIVLVTLGFILRLSDHGKTAFAVAAVSCFVLSAFSTWRKEHHLRLSLEHDSGPELYVEHKRVGLLDYFTFRNTGGEAAKNISLEICPNFPFVLDLVPPKISVIHAKQAEKICVVCCKQPRPNTRIGASLVEIVESVGSLYLDVIFENGKGVKFSTGLELSRVLVSLDSKKEISCDMQPRRLVSLPKVASLKIR